MKRKFKNWKNEKKRIYKTKKIKQISLVINYRSFNLYINSLIICEHEPNLCSN